MKARAMAPALGAAVLLAGCAGAQAPGSSARSMEGAGWALELPAGWRTWPCADGATASRLGRRLARIEVRVLPVPAGPAGGPAEGGTLADAARSAHARLSQAGGGAEATLVSVESVAFAGAAGFRAELASTDRAGLRHRAVLLCADRALARYCLAYEAAALRYFEAGLAEFEAIAATFRLGSDGAMAAEGAR